MTVGEALAWAKETLKKFPDANLEAEILLRFVLDQPRSFLHAWPNYSLTATEKTRFHDLILRRSKGEPVAYLTGSCEFWSLELLVNEATLIPRQETELLVETVLSLPDLQEKNIKVADLGTGSGALALALASERKHWQIFATDVSENALAIARKNAQRLGIQNVSFHQGSWCTALPSLGFDLIISNPPYIAETEWQTYREGLLFEPYQALVSGKEGLDAIREICHTAPTYLVPGGYLLIEHGFSQGGKIRALMQLEGYDSIHSIRDLALHERVTQARLVKN